MSNLINIAKNFSNKKIIQILNKIYLMFFDKKPN